MNIEIIDSYTEFCTAAHKELATIARANMGYARGGDAFWEDIADASSTGILLSLCETVRLPDVDECARTTARSSSRHFMPNAVRPALPSSNPIPFS